MSQPPPDPIEAARKYWSLYHRGVLTSEGLKWNCVDRGVPDWIVAMLLRSESYNDGSAMLDALEQEPEGLGP